MAGEFDLISRYFEYKQSQRDDVIQSVGDDCAIVQVPAGYQVAISTDTSVAGTHFLEDADPKLVAYKALASNLSDLAAMGAKPAWVSLALTLPKRPLEEQEVWLDGFCQGLFQLADAHQLQLIGGDTTQGPLSISFTIQGLLPNGQGLFRHDAKPGDNIYVSGDLGRSGAGLSIILGKLKTHHLPETDFLVKSHFLSTPRVLLGQGLLDKASAAIDISDGLISDLGHILKRSKLCAKIDVDALPIADEVKAFMPTQVDAQKLALTSGEEYELCFTAPSHKHDDIMQLSHQLDCPIQCIGQCFSPKNQDLMIELYSQQKKLDWQLHGFDHFKESHG